jgi:hypothetical protein
MMAAHGSATSGPRTTCRGPELPSTMTHDTFRFSDDSVVEIEGHGMVVFAARMGNRGHSQESTSSRDSRSTSLVLGSWTRPATTSTSSRGR